jgi:hypothetical protein
MSNMLLDGTVIVAAVYMVCFGAVVASETYIYINNYLRSLIIKN